jgi:hypothetical protein
LSKNNNEIKESTRETRFVIEVPLTTKVAYVSIRVSTKDWVSLDPNLAERSPRSVWFFTIKSPQRRGQYKLSEDHDNLGGFQRHLVCLGDKSPRVTNTERSSVKCFA